MVVYLKDESHLVSQVTAFGLFRKAAAGNFIDIDGASTTGKF